MKRLQINEIIELPEETVTKIKDTLQVYDKCHIEFTNGKYHVGTGFGIFSSYPEDFRVVGTAYAEDIYTPAERAEHRKEMEKYSWDY